MKLVFAHDHVFLKYNNKHYSSGGLSKEMLERYTKVFDEVVVISRQKKIQNYDHKLTLATTDRVKFIEIPDFKSIKSYNEIVKAKKIIENQLKTNDYLISRLPSSIGSLAVSAAKKYKKPYLIELVACPWDSLWNHSIKGKIVAPFVYLSTKKKVKEAPHTLYVTNEFLQRRYPTKGKSINCSNVVLKKYDDEVLDRKVNKIKNLEVNSKVIIGTTAALNVKYKGQRYIIEALGRLKEEGYTNYEYQLVGTGDQSYLKSIAKKYNVSDQVKFVGSLPHQEVFNWLETIDIYAQPSRQEGLPRALIEAMSRGLPAIGAKTAGIPELLEPEFIFSNTRNNIKEICNLLKKIDSDVMMTQSQRNFTEAKKYQHHILEEKRTDFFKEFKRSAIL